MSDDCETIDIGAGMAWGAMAPALAGGAIGLAGGPGLAFLVFACALSIAAAHVVVLALPLYGLLRIAGRRTDPATVLVAAAMIGALPATLWLGPGLGVWGGLFGLIGGGAFCAASLMRTGREEEA